MLDGLLPLAYELWVKAALLAETASPVPETLLNEANKARVLAFDI